ncbi:hypothetical protein GCM10025777_60810 [Membranihabitans marinus]
MSNYKILIFNCIGLVNLVFEGEIEVFFEKKRDKSENKFASSNKGPIFAIPSNEITMITQ